MNIYLILDDYRSDCQTFILNSDEFAGFFVKKLSSKHLIKIKLTVNNLYFFIIIYNAYVFADSNSCNLLTIHNYTHVLISFFLTTTDIITSQNIYLSFRITLYNT
jgi:hypothetical protein